MSQLSVIDPHVQSCKITGPGDLLNLDFVGSQKQRRPAGGPPWKDDAGETRRMDGKRSRPRRRVGACRRALAGAGGSLQFDLNCESLAWIAVALGLILRVWEYLEFRFLYIDEEALLSNLVGRAVFDFHQILDQDQMAPPGFLVIERLLVRLPLDVRASGRLLPLCCGLASVFLMHQVARRFLDRRVVPMAVGLFAVGDHLLYYSAEIKQYSCDLMMATAALCLAAGPWTGREGKARLWPLAVFGLVAPWFSFPVVFLLAGPGIYLLVSAAKARRWRACAQITLIGLGWLLSFAGCFLLSRSILSKRDFLWVWWNFAFLPFPPRSLADLWHLAETLANVFINPASLLTPFSLPVTAVLASALAVIGCLSLGRRWPGGLFLLIAPLLFALLASGLRQYPFHGRLLLFLVPTFLLLPCEGAAAIGRRTGWLVMLALAALLIYGQASDVFWHKVVQSRYRPFDSHGDLKNDLLDYLELQRKGRLPPFSR